MTSHMLQEPHITAEKEFNIKWSALSAYGAGADTANFFLTLT